MSVKLKHFASLHYLYLGILIIISLFFLFYNLGTSSLQNWDEAIYALISQETVQSPSLSLQLNGTPWLEKPPLDFFVKALFIKTFGFSEWVLRLPSAIYLLIAVLLIYFIGKELFNKHLGFASSLLFLLSPAFMHSHFARSGDLEGGFLLFLVLSFYLLIKAKQKPQLLIWSGLTAGLALMMRGSTGLFIIIISALYLWLSGQWRSFKLKHYLGYALAWLVIVLPWHVQQLIVNGRDFWNIYLMEHFLSRISQPIQAHSGAWYYYFDYLQKTQGWWQYLAYLAFIYTTFKLWLQKDKALLLPWLWLVIPFLAIIIMATKLNWYVITILPALAYLTVYFLFDITKKKNIIIPWRAVLVLLVVIYFGWSFLVTDYQWVTKPQIDPIEKIAGVIAEKYESQAPIVIYQTQVWYNGWILPQTDYYLSRRQGHQLFLAKQETIAKYANSNLYQLFITNQSGLDDLQQLANFAIINKSANLILAEKVNNN